MDICKETGFLAGHSCPSTKIILPAGTAPETTCPIHGEGTWDLAASDPNAPKLLLSPNDQEVLGVTVASAPIYSINLPEIEGQQLVVSPLQTQETLVEVKRKQKEPSKKVKIPLPKQEHKLPKERSPEEVEKRFRELLKQYGITDE